MLTKSRRRLIKSSEGARGLSDQAVEDDGDMCRDRGGVVADMLLHGVWGSGAQNHRWTVFEFGPQNPVEVPMGTRGGHGVIMKLISRRSKVMKSPCPSDAWISS